MTLFPPPATISAEAWQEALENQDGNPVAAARTLMDKGILSSLTWCSERSKQLGWEYHQAPDLEKLDAVFPGTLGYGNAKRMGILPAFRENGRTTIWLRSDIDWDTLLEAMAEYGINFNPVIIPDEEFNRALQRAFESKGAAVDAVEYLDESIDLETASAAIPESADLLDSQDDAPIIRLLNAVLAQAIEEHASDVHIEPYETKIVIRYRVDGILRDVIELPGGVAGRTAARIKVMARLNIAEKRLPQDGRIRLRMAGRSVDVRVSTLPTHYGERLVMRILEKEQGPLALKQIGMPSDVRDSFTDLIRSPHGIFLVTGPTGSGKTTTLYAALQQVQKPDVNIITVEDPIEFDLAGIAQIPVNLKTGMTFDKGLRAILRQDPDVIMVGEIRDIETAEIAVQASLTGHLVFSTLHTNDAVGSITRLVDMGVEPYLVASSLIGVMAQRLVRKLCPQCREVETPDQGQRQLLGISQQHQATIYKPHGCERCGYTGYHGRTGVYELMVITDEIRHIIHDNHGEQSLRIAGSNAGMRSLREDGIAKVLNGDTSLEEVLRVTRS